MAAQDLIVLGIGPSSATAIKYLMTFGLDIAASTSIWTPVAADGAETWTAQSPDAAEVWTPVSPATTTWT